MNNYGIIMQNQQILIHIQVHIDMEVFALNH